MLRQAPRAVVSVLISQDAAAMLHHKVGSQSVLDDLTFFTHEQKGRKRNMTVYSVLYMKIKYT